VGISLGLAEAAAIMERLVRELAAGKAPGA
jgi:hypothetical protein